jgi:hypothetical protein
VNTRSSIRNQAEAKHLLEQYRKGEVNLSEEEVKRIIQILKQRVDACIEDELRNDYQKPPEEAKKTTEELDKKWLLRVAACLLLESQGK